MKISYLVARFLCFALTASLLVGCRQTEGSISRTDPVEITVVDPATLTGEKSYHPGSGALMTSYNSCDADTFQGVCAHYRKKGYDLYCSADQNGNRFCTFTKGDALAHVYWIDSQRELNLITDADGAEALPSNVAVDGSKPTGITQLQQEPHQVNGMGYIITLADGSFILYDGGHQETAQELMEVLTECNGGSKQDIHIRAWVITHSHWDHHSAFSEFARTYRENDLDVQLDCVMIAPLNDEIAEMIDPVESLYFSETVYEDIRYFDGAEICYVYTGMVFTLANVELEILFTPEELFIDGNIDTSDKESFNESSLVSRISACDPEESGETLTMIFLGDAGDSVGERLICYYGDGLRSDMVQISHHGVEDFPLAAYQIMCPSILFYPCNMELYNLPDRDAEVRQALREAASTKEILLRDNGLYTRYLDPRLNPSANTPDGE